MSNGRFPQTSSCTCININNNLIKLRVKTRFGKVGSMAIVRAGTHACSHACVKELTLQNQGFSAVYSEIIPIRSRMQASSDRCMFFRDPPSGPSETF